MLFFGTLSIGFMLIGLVLGSIPAIEFMKTGLITHFPRAILSTGLVLTSIILSAMGIILDTINFRMKEMIQIHRKKFKY
jgi:hypothetical protein